MSKFITVFIFIFLSLKLVCQIKYIDSLDQNILHQAVFSTHSGLKICHLNETTGNLKIHNEDFSIYKEIPLEISKGYNVVKVMYLSQGLFDLDDEIEFLFFESNGLKSNTKIINEDGSILMEFEKSDGPAVFQGKDSAILVLRSGKFDGETKRTLFKTKYYSLPGKLE